MANTFVLIMTSILTLGSGATEMNSKAIQMGTFEQCMEAAQYVNHKAPMPKGLEVYAFCKPLEQLNDYRPGKTRLTDFLK